MNGFTPSHSFKPTTTPLTVRHFSPRNRFVLHTAACVCQCECFTVTTLFPSAHHTKPLCLLRNHNKPHLRPTIPTADRSAGLLDNPALFSSFPTERLNGVRSSPPSRLPTSQNRTRLPSNTAFPRRDPVGTGRVPEPTTPDYSRGRYVSDAIFKSQP